MKLEKEISQSAFRNDKHKLGVNLIFTYNWLNNIHADFLKKHDITSQQFNVLRILRGQQQNPASLKTIRNRMLDRMSDVSRIVEKLRVKNLLERTISTSDRRECEVVITQKGLDLLERIDKDNDPLDNLFLTLSNEEITQLNNLLDKLRG